MATLAVAGSLAAPARADAPPPPPAEVTVASPHGACLATAGLHPPRTVVRSRDRASVDLWSIPRWEPNIVFGDDCQTLGVGYDRGTLLELDEKRPGTPVMTFYRRGQVARVVTLGELYPDLGVLPRTASHWRWLEWSTWSGQAWTVRTVDGRTLTFAP